MQTNNKNRGNEMIELNKIHNMDCLEFMKTVPDNFYDLCLTDPPYGIGMDGKVGINGAGRAKEYQYKNWD